MKFGKIEDIKIINSIHVSKRDVSLESLNTEEITLAEETAAKAKTKLNNDVKTLDMLKALRLTIARYGVTRSLIAFADYDKSLSSTIPEIPSIENFKADLSAKKSVGIILAIGNKISELTNEIAVQTGVAVESLNVDVLLKDANEAFESNNDTKLLESLEHLKALRDSVQKYGLTRSLVSFADYDKNLSTYIPEIPSIENLISDKSVKNSAHIVVAIEGKISDILNLFKDKIKAFFLKFNKKQKESEEKVKHLYNRVSEYETELKSGSRVFNKNLAKNIILSKYRAVSFSDLIKAFKSANSTGNVINQIGSLKIPLTEEEFKRWILDVTTKLKTVEDFIGIKIENNKVVDSKTPILNLTDENNLIEFGYDGIEKFYTIYTGIKSVHKNEMVALNAFSSAEAGWNIPEEASVEVANVVCDVYEDLLQLYVDKIMGLYYTTHDILEHIYKATEEKKD